MEAWQDFINLKGRMDMELSKVSKRNNFLVEELESWKQQFLKFQTFAEQLTKETNELKIKIEGHKRENRRLNAMIEQHKEDSARMTVRLSGTEKQRDDALQALVLQQEIAEELERERKRNKKDLSALQHTNVTLLRQRDEAQRVVLHLRALIDGQAHHMEHIVKSINDVPEAAELINATEENTADAAEKPAEKEQPETSPVRPQSGAWSRTSSRGSMRMSQNRTDGEEPSSALKSRASMTLAARKRVSGSNMTDVADRHLRDKTDAIAYIIRNISEQCAAAVEGLDLARRADTTSSDGGDDDQRSETSKSRGKRPMKRMSSDSMTAGGDNNDNGSEYDYGDNRSEARSSYLRPKRGSSNVPPTPELVHDRSSTSMSVTSESTTATPQRYSLQSQYRSHEEGIPEVPTQIVDHETLESLEEEQPVTKFSARPLENQSATPEQIH
jgi:hypothetical protein